MAYLCLPARRQALHADRSKGINPDMFDPLSEVLRKEATFPARFTSGILPKYLHKTKNLEELISWLSR